jgi:cytosine/adenosine deaminase-related metal-dependent hydrolase
MAEDTPSDLEMTYWGTIYGPSGSREGHVTISGGRIVDISYGGCPDRSDIEANILTGVVNAHTHCADYGLSIPQGMSLEELVAPPDGLKHRYLRESSDEVLTDSMKRFSKSSRAFGSTTFVDFREGGVHGCRLLRQAEPDSIILGRPVSPMCDPGEIDEILSVADGIGLPSISDMPSDYIDDIADEVRSRNGILAIHVSERVREDIDAVLSLDPAFVVHMCEATDDDLLKCAEAEVPIVVCPTSNMYFGKVPPIARMQDCGVDLALGTDNGMLCQPDMVSEVRRMSSIAASQGGDADSCWKSTTLLSSKLLNGNARMGVLGKVTPMVICPVEGGRDIVVNHM